MEALWVKQSPQAKCVRLQSCKNHTVIARHQGLLQSMLIWERVTPLWLYWTRVRGSENAALCPTFIKSPSVYCVLETKSFRMCCDTAQLYDSRKRRAESKDPPIHFTAPRFKDVEGQTYTGSNMGSYSYTRLVKDNTRDKMSAVSSRQLTRITPQCKGYL